MACKNGCVPDRVFENQYVSGEEEVWMERL